ncbi:MAG: integration host factor subunit alpha [Rickettsiales bacterium]|nr:integration host factor subunit alpha [Rickettsiales bacterium]
MSQTLTRAILTEAIYSEIGLSQAESATLIDEVLEEMTNSLANGEEVKISSFGSFRVRKKNARIGRNPKTKEEVVITPRSVVTFHASNIMKKKINEKEEDDIS